MSTPRTFQRLDPATRRDQILDAANALFAERGYDEVTIEDVARSAGVARGLVHHYFGGRKEVYLALLERLGAGREEQLRPPSVAALARGWRTRCHAGWTGPEANRTIYLGTIAPGEDIADPDVRRVVADLVRRAVALVAALHADIAEDSPRLRYALECWTGLNRAATRRWLRGEADPRGDARAARLDPRTRPPHVRLTTETAHLATEALALRRAVSSPGWRAARGTPSVGE